MPHPVLKLTHKGLLFELAFVSPVQARPKSTVAAGEQDFAVRQLLAAATSDTTSCAPAARSNFVSIILGILL